MLKKTGVKIGIILLVVIVLMGINIDVYAAINETYYTAIEEDLNVVDGYLDSKVKSSVLLDAISILVYSVGSMLEWVLGLIFTGISGNKIFPWADAILFNAIPLLDINIFNPSGASLVAVMQDFIAKSYWTVFTLACTFLGIAIMVTAIKLVVSTIASDKATYKQAIMKWLMGFVMLWGIHFFMSFALFLNESLVETASEIAQEATQNSSIDLGALRFNSQTDQETVYNFAMAMSDDDWNIQQWVSAIVVVVGTAVAIYFAWPAIAGGAITASVIAGFAGGTVIGASGMYMLENGSKITLDEFITVQGQIIQGVRSKEMEEFKATGKDGTLDFLSHSDSVMVAAKLLRNEDYVDSLQAVCTAELVGSTDEISWKKQHNEEAIYYLAADTRLIIRNTYIAKVDGEETGELDYNKLLEQYLDSINKVPTSEKVSRIVDDDFSGTSLVGNLANPDPDESQVNYDQMLDWYCRGMIYAREDYLDRLSGGDGVQDKSNIISTLAKAFKDMAWTTTEKSWTPSKPVIQGALMYAILVAQSLIFFISYAKRLFYVIILILMAPVVVVYDFFTRFSS